MKILHNFYWIQDFGGPKKSGNPENSHAWWTVLTPGGLYLRADMCSPRYHWGPLPLLACRQPSQFQYLKQTRLSHDDVIKWKHFPRYWSFVRGIHRSPVNSPHKGQWHGALIFSLICVWINGWVNNREAGDLRCYRAHSDVSVMFNSLWPGDTVWQHGTRSTLAQVMACCLMAPSHYLNQCSPVQRARSICQSYLNRTTQ